ncbi:hypothetical protein N780_17420 [Pontibacillus chungwhensis BH030062]|uniref:Uncharacterized protein n=1 Tax=Pontibacillus chungwhensis BH030062 TaxID=1385513 RepID=A0A0A2UT83_9BACI|nr:hypothetical protein N780_17420 [Pontibacillus chungwhensis BH030062]
MLQANHLLRKKGAPYAGVGDLITNPFVTEHIKAFLKTNPAPANKVQVYKNHITHKKRPFLNKKGRFY